MMPLQKIMVPNPPRCASAATNAILRGDQVIITLLKSQMTLKGHLHGIDLKEGNVFIDVEGQRKELGSSVIKRIQVIKALKWIPVHLAGSSIEEYKNIANLETQNFSIQFVDDDVLEGQTLGFHDQRIGLHLYPVIPNKDHPHYFYNLIPHAAIKSHQVGRPLGELLVNTGAVTADQVQTALENQQAHRTQPLGEVLKTYSIVTANDLKNALSRQALTPKVRLGEVLVSTGVITEEQLQYALDLQRNNRKQKVGDILVQQGIVNRRQIQKSLAQKLGIPLVELSKIEIDFESAKLIPEKLVRRYTVLPIMSYDNRLVVAIDDPLNNEALEEVRFISQNIVEPVMAAREDIEAYINRVYSALSQDSLDLEAAANEFAANEQPLVDNTAIADNKIVRLVNQIIMDAYAQGVSDIHLEPYGRDKPLQVRFRLDGSLVRARQIPPGLRAALIARVKIMANLDIAERRKPQDGKINFKRFGPLKIELRVATIPTNQGEEDVVMRILAAGDPLPLKNLGLSAGNHQTLQQVIDKPYGLFFVCGPTGSGKTTTLHSILAHLNTPENKIWTVEDPIEITQAGLRQVQVLPKIGLTFATAMRAFLRADPDIIMLGEMRDVETTKTGVEAALTGHLVLSTLHTNSAPESVVRLLDMGMDPFNFSDALLGVLAQRLAKRLCSHCKQAYSASDREIEELLDNYCAELIAASETPADHAHIRHDTLAAWRQHFANAQGEFILHRAQGCHQCADTGYRGRVGLHELMAANDAIKLLIQKRCSVALVTQEAVRAGMRTLRQDGIEKVLQGITDFAQIKKVCIR